MNISRIGPLAIDRLIEPTSISVSGGSSTTSPSVPIKASFRLASRTDAERLEELVNNPDRRQSIKGARGVLEWVECADALARWKGWWLIDSCDVGLSRMQLRRADPLAAYVPVTLSASFFGAEGTPSVVATHRELVDDFGLIGKPITVPLYPSNVVAGWNLSRSGSAANVYSSPSAIKRSALRLTSTSFSPASFASHRPLLRDAAGVAHYGPRRGLVSADGARLESAHLRLTIGQTVENQWLVEGWIAGAWYGLGALRVKRVLGAPVEGLDWSIVATSIRDDRVAVTLLSDDETTMRVEIRVGELGMRLTAGAAYYLQWLTTADGSAGVATKTANAYQDSVAHANGSRRFIALVKTQMSEDLVNWTTRINAGHTALVGFVPPTPGADDTSAEQGKQLLFDRTEALTLV